MSREEATAMTFELVSLVTVFGCATTVLGGVGVMFGFSMRRVDASFEKADARVEKLEAKMDEQFAELRREVAENTVAIARLEGRRQHLILGTAR